MPHRLAPLVPAVLLLAACGSSGGDKAVPPPPVDETPNVTTARTATNDIRLAELLALRDQCGGADLPTVTTTEYLITAAVRHAGWQALYDQKHGGASLNHYEEESEDLPLYTNWHPAQRIIDAGGPNIPMAEDIASMSDDRTMGFLWNTVYHRLPMAMHLYTLMGYGDLALARSEYPGVAFPAVSPWDNTSDNGYATIDWHGPETPTITFSYWPGAGLIGVPYVFSSDSEMPDPVPGQDDVGPPLHLILPTTKDLTSLTARVRRSSGGADLTLRILVGIGLSEDPIHHTLPAGTVADDLLDAGQIFILPLAPLLPDTDYLWSCTATDTDGIIYTLADTAFRTAATVDWAPRSARAPLRTRPFRHAGRADGDALPLPSDAALARAYAALGAEQDGRRPVAPLTAADQAQRLLAQTRLQTNAAPQTTCRIPRRTPRPVHGDADKVITGDDTWAAIPYDPRRTGGTPLTLRNAGGVPHGFSLHGDDFGSVRVNGGYAVPGRTYRLDGIVTITSTVPVAVHIRPLAASATSAAPPQALPTNRG